MDADDGEKIAQHAEIGMRHQLPHQCGQGRRRHQRQQQQDGGDVVEARRPLQQQRDAQAQQQFENHRQESIGKRDVDGVPELRIGEEVDVVLEPDEALHGGQVHPVAQHRIIDGGEERDENPDAHQQCGKGQDIGQGPAHEAALLDRHAHLCGGGCHSGARKVSLEVAEKRRAGDRRESVPRAPVVT